MADGTMMIIIFFVFALLVFIGKIVLGDFNEQAQDDPDFSNETKELLQEQDDNYSGFFDGLIMFAFMIIWIGTIIASFMIDSHPIFFFFMFVILVIICIIGAMLGNSYEDITEDEDLAVVATGFPMTDFILSHYLMTILVIAFSIVIALYGKNRWMG